MSRNLKAEPTIFVDCTEYSYLAGCEDHSDFRDVFTNFESAWQLAKEHRKRMHDNKGGIDVRK